MCNGVFFNSYLIIPLIFIICCNCVWVLQVVKYSILISKSGAAGAKINWPQTEPLKPSMRRPPFCTGWMQSWWVGTSSQKPQRRATLFILILLLSTSDGNRKCSEKGRHRSKIDNQQDEGHTFHLPSRLFESWSVSVDCCKCFRSWKRVIWICNRIQRMKSKNEKRFCLDSHW